MVLHCELIWDDDIAVAGTAIATTDCVGHDGEVDDIDGVLPVLRDVMLYTDGVAGALSDAINEFGRYLLKPTNWAGTEALTGYSDGGVYVSVHTEAQTPSFNLGGSGGRPGGANFIQSYGRYNVPLSKNTNWASGASYLYASEANEDMYLTLCYSYGPTYPYRGGKITWVRKVADAVEAAAEVFDNAFTSKLTTVDPGLDPTKQYVLRAIGYHNATAAKIAGAVRAGKETGAHRIIGQGAGDGSIGGTFFHWDGIPVSGNDAIIAESHSIVVETAAPFIVMGFEEWGPATAQGTMKPAAIGGVAPGLGLGAPARQGGFGGIFGLGR